MGEAEMRRVFQAGGAIPPDSPIYVEREADRLVRQRIEQMDYVHIIVARQMGKTSLLHRVAAQLGGEKYAFAWVELSGMKDLERAEWYSILAKRIREQLAWIKGMPAEWLSKIASQEDLQDFFSNIMQLAGESRRVVVMLDEIDSTRLLPFSDAFFSKLRTLYNIRPARPIFRNLTFVLVGATDPRRLIKDPDISPFNIGKEIGLEEFSPAETRQLTDNLAHVGIEASNEVHSCIYWWTSGQPYLIQKVCETLEDWHSQRGITQATPELIDLTVEESIISSKANDSNISHIKAQVERQLDVRRYLKRVLDGEQIKFEPDGATNGRLAELYLIGVVKEGPDGNTVVRNRIYEAVLRDYIRIEDEKEAESLRRQLLIHKRNLNRLEETRAQYGLNPPLALVNEIEYERAEIQRIERELRER
jgi:hypothetical protein